MAISQDDSDNPMMKTQHHIVSAYDDELKKLSNITITMLSQSQKMLEQSVDALKEKKDTQARHVVKKDDKVDALEASGEELAIRMIALRQPMGADLRMIIASLKMNSDIERIADYASNIAKKVSLVLGEKDAERRNRCIDHCVPGMASMAQELLSVGHDVIRLIENPSASHAVTIWKRDASINDHYVDNFKTLSLCLKEDKAHVAICTHFIFIIKDMERIGDHFKNVAESIFYYRKGVPFSKHLL
ncbi:MAG: phosphate signaling complex protein PhoU [Alphaproteobacteria bacterium GM7ARS4]|nr:phosphate signaling complex protein PhoU [Alphaproteobacteria bacterium GM7ARS4]